MYLCDCPPFNGSQIVHDVIDIRVTRFSPKLGKIVPKLGQIRGFFHIRFSTFRLGEIICPIWGPISTTLRQYVLNFIWKKNSEFVPFVANLPTVIGDIQCSEGKLLTQYRRSMLR